jgi:CBS domain-containing protein
MNFDPHQRRVKDEMSTDVVSIDSEAPLLTVLDLMEEHDVTALPVVDKDSRCIGMISTTDIACVARTTAIELQKLGQVDGDDRPNLVRGLVASGMALQSVHRAMRYKLKCVHEETSIAKAGNKMLWTRFHHLPVVDEEQRLVGIISTMDLLAAFVKGTSGQTDHRSIDETETDTAESEKTIDL